MKMIMKIYNPEVIVLQSGADSTAYDLIGEFNLSSIAHGEAINFMLKYNLPMIILGGGGYNLKNVAKL
jgi:histone deacetylase 1/2